MQVADTKKARFMNITIPYTQMYLIFLRAVLGSMSFPLPVCSSSMLVNKFVWNH